MPSSIRTQALYNYHSDHCDNLITEHIAVQDLDRVFGQEHYERNVQDEPTYVIDQSRFPLSNDSIRLDGSKSQLMLMIEFKLIGDGRLASVREVGDAGYEERVFEFAVNGNIHGRKMFE